MFKWVVIDALLISMQLEIDDELIETVFSVFSVHSTEQIQPIIQELLSDSLNIIKQIKNST